jgi:putative hydrolase of the HAD superfamily
MTTDIDQRFRDDGPRVIRAVVFDLDDTLYAERDYAVSGFTAVAQAFAGTLGDPETCRLRMCRIFDTEQRRRVFNQLLQEMGLKEDEELIARMIETYRSHEPAITLRDDAGAALRRLKGHYKLGVISDGFLDAQRAKIKALGLRERVDEIIITDELGRAFWKPHARAFECMSERLGVEPSACAYVADNPAKDFIAPRQLGWRTIQILHKDGIYWDQDAPQGGAPDFVISCLDSLEDCLE